MAAIPPAAAPPGQPTTTRATRATTGNSRPRVFPKQEPKIVIVKPRKATKKSAAKANITAKRSPVVKASKPVGVKKSSATSGAGAKKATPATAAEAKKAAKKVGAAIALKSKAKKRTTTAAKK